MANFIKRVRAYVAPVVLVYTVMVTWLLISTAWSEQDDQEGEHRVRRGLTAGEGGKSFIDVIVQEERRHMKSFKNAVQTYRDASVDSDKDLNGYRDAAVAIDKESNVNRDANVDSDKGPNGNRDATVDSDKDLKSNAKGQAAPQVDKQKRGRPTRRRNALTKDSALRLRPGKRRVSSNDMGEEDQGAADPDDVEGHDSNRPGSLVEVEEWDETRARETKTKDQKAGRGKTSDSETDDPKREKVIIPSLVDVEINVNPKSKNSIVLRNASVSTQESDYFIRFCDRVFDDPRVVPNLCDRPLIESTNRKHIPMNSASLSFRRLGGIKVYSTFLDVRGEPSVRAMVLAPSEQANGPSTYWCVFHTQDKPGRSGESNNRENQDFQHSPLSEKVDDSKEVSSIDRQVNNTAVESLNKSSSDATVMSFYAASDGHGRPYRFYIASCPVPQGAFSLFSNPDQTLTSVQLTVGSLTSAFLGAVQESTLVDVIINKPIDKGQYPADNHASLARKTLLVDVKRRVYKKHDVFKESGRPKDSNKSFPRNGEANDSSTVNNLPKREAVVVFELDDDDEDKEISREKKSRTVPRRDKPIGPGGINIPYPQTSHVGEVIVSCTAPLHGRVSTVQVVEFVELSLLLGVQHIVFYLSSSSELAEAREALRMYETRGLVTAMPWDLPGLVPGQGNQASSSGGDTDDVWARGRDAALNDCLYRTMHGFHWAIFLDLDEFFVPRVTPDLPSFLRYLAEQHRFNASRVTDLVFPSAFFPPPTRAHYKNLTSAQGFLRELNRFSTLKSVHRTYFDQKQTLRMVRPLTATRVGAGERKRTSFTLSHRYASVHHYSFCPRIDDGGVPKGAITKSQAARVSCSHLKVDWTMWRFKTLLIERARSAMRLLNKG